MTKAKNKVKELSALHQRTNELEILVIGYEKSKEAVMNLSECFLNFGPNSIENIENITKTAGEILGGVCALYNRLEGDSLCTVGKWQAPTDMPLVDKVKGHICFDVISASKKNEPFIVRNLDQSPYAESDPNVKKYNLKTYVGYVVKVKNKPVGSLCVVYQKDKEFKSIEIEILSILARVLGVEEERKEAEKELWESRKFVEDLIASMKDGISILDKKGVHINVNTSFCHMTGFTREELIGTGPPHLYWPEEECKNIEEAFQKTLKGESEDFELIFKRKNGERFPVIVSPSCLKDKQGNIINYFATVKDITEYKRMIEKLTQSERMAGVGQLAAGVAHEFNNLLNIIGSAAEYANDIEDEKEIRESLDIIIKSSDRGTDVVKNLLKFAGRIETKRQSADIVEVIEEILGLVKRDLGKSSVTIARNYSSVPKTIIDIGQVQQVFLNLVLNAQRAMSKGGRLTINLEREDGFIKIQFHNTGKHIKKEDLPRLFTPFFKLEGEKKGELSRTGLGLSVSYGIIQAHNGTIEVESERRKGTAFTIRLPIVEKGETPEIEKKSVKDVKEWEIKTKQTNILVIDDEENICNLFKKVLEKEGHMVSIANNSKTAINLYKNNSFDLVYLDIVIPGMEGIEIFKKMLKIDPNSKIVLITGKLIEDKVAEMYINKGAIGFLRKPFPLKKLVNYTKAILSKKE